MKRITIIILLLLGFRYEGYCQLIESAGPNSTALAGLNANNVDVWSINYNVGQLQNLERSSIAVSFHQPFLLSDFTIVPGNFNLLIFEIFDFDFS